MTSIEWFYNEIKHIIPNDFLGKFEQAKEMHKQEIIDTYLLDELDSGRKYAEQYYQETFVSKGHPSVISENGNELLFDKEGNLIKELPK